MPGRGISSVVPRSIWTGSLAFGLVNVPVGLYSATQDKTIRFHQFERGTASRIRYKRVNGDTGEEVDYDDIVKGADVGDGRYVLLTPEELEAVEPGRSRTIDISDFVDAREIDPIFYQKTYYLAPREEAGQRAYTLLTKAMHEADRVGIATFVMRSKQYLAAVRPKGEVLTLETMFFADEVRDARQIESLPTQAEVGQRDLDMAFSLIESMTTPWDPSNYADTYRGRVEELIEAKLNDQEVVVEGGAPEGGQVVDLMEALRASLDRARGHQPGNADQREQRLQRRPSGPARSTGQDHRLADLSKDELYERARDLGVSGRSSMSKDQLLDAVRAAEGQRPTGAQAS